MANPNEISLIAIGPLTNIGLAIKAFPEVKDNIKDVFIMGGNHKGKNKELIMSCVNSKVSFKGVGLSFRLPVCGQLKTTIDNFRTWKHSFRRRVQLLGRPNSSAHCVEFVRMPYDRSYIRVWTSGQHQSIKGIN